MKIEIAATQVEVFSHDIEIESLCEMHSGDLASYLSRNICDRQNSPLQIDVASIDFRDGEKTDIIKRIAEFYRNYDERIKGRLVKKVREMSQTDRLSRCPDSEPVPLTDKDLRKIRSASMYASRRKGDHLGYVRIGKYAESTDREMAYRAELRNGLQKEIFLPAYASWALGGANGELREDDEGNYCVFYRDPIDGKSRFISIPYTEPSLRWSEDFDSIFSGEWVASPSSVKSSPAPSGELTEPRILLEAGKGRFLIKEWRFSLASSLGPQQFFSQREGKRILLLSSEFEPGASLLEGVVLNYY